MDFISFYFSFSYSKMLFWVNAFCENKLKLNRFQRSHRRWHNVYTFCTKLKYLTNISWLVQWFTHQLITIIDRITNIGGLLKSSIWRHWTRKSIQYALSRLFLWCQILSCFHFWTQNVQFQWGISFANCSTAFLFAVHQWGRRAKYIYITSWIPAVTVASSIRSLYKKCIEANLT